MPGTGYVADMARFCLWAVMGGRGSMGIWAKMKRQGKVWVLGVDVPPCPA